MKFDGVILKLWGLPLAGYCKEHISVYWAQYKCITHFKCSYHFW